MERALAERFPPTDARRRDPRRCRPADDRRDRSQDRRCPPAPSGRASASAGCSRAAGAGRHRDVGVGAGPSERRPIDLGRANASPAAATRPRLSRSARRRRPWCNRCTAASRGRPDLRRSPTLRRTARAHNRRPAREGSAACHRERRAKCMPSPVISRSGDGETAAPIAPATNGATPSNRTRVFHRHSQMPPATMQPKAHPGMDGSSATAPGAEAAACASLSSPSIDAPHSHHSGWPQPATSSSSAPASSGMITKVVSGMAMMFAPTPYRPARWKWNKASGISASSTARPVSDDPEQRPPEPRQRRPRPAA